eukprot:UN12307
MIVLAPKIFPLPKREFYLQVTARDFFKMKLVTLKLSKVEFD